MWTPLIYFIYFRCELDKIPIFTLFQIITWARSLLCRVTYPQKWFLQIRADSPVMSTANVSLRTGGHCKAGCLTNEQNRGYVGAFSRGSYFRCNSCPNCPHCQLKGTLNWKINIFSSYCSCCYCLFQYYIKHTNVINFSVCVWGYKWNILECKKGKCKKCNRKRKPSIDG